jgi:hypothetical protein
VCRVADRLRVADWQFNELCGPVGKVRVVVVSHGDTRIEALGRLTSGPKRDRLNAAHGGTVTHRRKSGDTTERSSNG